jgi:hypothetical protein
MNGYQPGDVENKGKKKLLDWHAVGITFQYKPLRLLPDPQQEHFIFYSFFSGKVLPFQIIFPFVSANVREESQYFFFAVGSNDTRLLVVFEG